MRSALNTAQRSSFFFFFFSSRDASTLTCVDMQAREAKRVRSVVLPKLNLAGVVATRDRIEALATSPTHRFRQRKPAAPRDEEPLYLGLQRVPRG